MHKNIRKEFQNILEFIGLTVAENIIDEAIKYTQFENMKKMEKQDKFNMKRLRPGNKKDPESYKTRRGKVGGYKDYLSKKEIIVLNKKMKHLTKFYGYSK